MEVLTGTVTRIDRNNYTVHCAGKTYRCPIRGRYKGKQTHNKKLVAVGDEVEFIPLSAKQGVIEQVLPRKSKLSRATLGRPGLEQVVVANVDQVLIVSAVDQPPLRPGLIDRMLVAAHCGNLNPLICINKADLPALSELESIIAIYRDLGYPVLLTSTKQGTGIAELRQHLKDHKTVFAGHSGVGKSSLLASVEPGLQLKTLPVSRKTHKGRHATTAVSLIPLSIGGYVVDTPGIRTFNLWQVRPQDVSQYYVEMQPLRQYCKYPSCTHTHEPQCAVKQALEEGEITSLRYHNYCRILETLQGKERNQNT